MRPVNQSRRRHRPLGLLLPVVALLALAGCESGFGSRQSGGDPFLGIHAPPTPVQSAGGGAAATQTATNTPPSLPASISVPNQAALASGTKQTPDNPRDLRIETPVVPVSSPGGAATGNVRVDGPVPIPETTSKTMPPSVAAAGTPPTGGAAVPPPPGASMTFEEAQRYLKQRGVVWQRLETRGDTGQWAFQCSLPISGQKNLNRTYETQTPLPRDPLSAVRAVIDKIEKDQR